MDLIIGSLSNVSVTPFKMTEVSFTNFSAGPAVLSVIHVKVKIKQRVSGD